LDEGSDVLLEIDVQGALRVRAACPWALLVFLAVPSREEQRQRLLDRGGLSEAQVEGRLAGAEGEEAMAGVFDRIVVNDELKRAVSEVAGILTERRRL
ncbi:MAG: guanylate kinase, partial [Acidimicrobiia bacterium]